MQLWLTTKRHKSVHSAVSTKRRGLEERPLSSSHFPSLKLPHPQFTSLPFFPPVTIHPSPKLLFFQSCPVWTPPSVHSAQCGLFPVCTLPNVKSWIFHVLCQSSPVWNYDFVMPLLFVKLLHSFYLNLNQNFRYLCCSAVLMKSCRFIRLIPILFYQYILDIVLQIVLNDTYWWFSEIIYHSRAKKKNVTLW